VKTYRGGGEICPAPMGRGRLVEKKKKKEKKTPITVDFDSIPGGSQRAGRASF